MVLKILSKKKYSPSEVIELLSIYWVCSLTKPITDIELRVVFEPPSINCTCLLKWLIHCSWFYTSKHTLSMLTHWFTGQLKEVFQSTTIDWVLLIYPSDISYWTCWTNKLRLSLLTYSRTIGKLNWVCSLTQLIVVIESPSTDWVCLLTKLIVQYRSDPT